jgi:hypothetical protein
LLVKRDQRIFVRLADFLGLPPRQSPFASRVATRKTRKIAALCQAAALQARPNLAFFAAAVAKVESGQWKEDGAIRAQLQRILLPLCAYYLLHGKQQQEPLRGKTPGEAVSCWLSNPKYFWRFRAGSLRQFIVKLSGGWKEAKTSVREFDMSASLSKGLIPYASSRFRMPTIIVLETDGAVSTPDRNSTRPQRRGNSAGVADQYAPSVFIETNPGRSKVCVSMCPAGGSALSQRSD